MAGCEASFTAMRVSSAYPPLRSRHAHHPKNRPRPRHRVCDLRRITTAELVLVHRGPRAHASSVCRRVVRRREASAVTRRAHTAAAQGLKRGRWRELAASRSLRQKCELTVCGLKGRLRHRGRLRMSRRSRRDRARVCCRAHSSLVLGRLGDRLALRKPRGARVGTEEGRRRRRPRRDLCCPTPRGTRGRGAAAVPHSPRRNIAAAVAVQRRPQAAP